MTESHRIPGWKDKALFTLGPLTTSCTVKQAMLRDLGSRGLELIEIVRSIRGRLLDLGGVQKGDYEAIIMQGSGTFSLEAEAVAYGDEDQARENAGEALKQQIDPLEAVEGGLSKGMDVIGEQFECGEVFLPELLMAAAAFDAAMEILQPEIEAQGKEIAKLGTVLISTVKGDVNNIGKNIVTTVLGIKGFKVVDTGVDNSTLDIIEEAQKARADIIALSSLMTTTMPAQKEVIDVLGEMNLRDQFFVMVGGGPVTQEWGDEIGADGYGKSAIQAAETAKRLMLLKG